jgi:uridine kinase
MNKMEYPNVSEEELKLFIPSGIIVSGPSSSGKTELVLKILRNIGVLFDPSPKAIGREFYLKNNLHF